MSDATAETCPNCDTPCTDNALVECAMCDKNICDACDEDGLCGECAKFD